MQVEAPIWVALIMVLPGLVGAATGIVALMIQAGRSKVDAAGVITDSAVKLVEPLEERIDELEKKLECLECSVKERDERIEELECENKKLKEEAGVLKEEMEVLRCRIRELEAR